MSKKPIEFDDGIEVNANSFFEETLTANNIVVTGDLNVSGNLSFTGFSAASILPSSNNLYTLGSNTNYWSDIYSTYIVSNSSHISVSSQLILPASNTSKSSIRFTPSTTTPTSLANGDMWTTNNNILYRANSATKTIAFIDSDITGNANTATKLKTPVTLTLSGNVSGNVSFDGSSNTSIVVTIDEPYYSITAANSTFLPFSGGTLTGNLLPNANGLLLGNSSKRFDVSSTNLNASGDVVVGGNVSISGVLLVDGSPIDVTSGALISTANGIVLNSDNQSANGIHFTVTRPSQNNVSLRWNESSDKWEMTNDGVNYGNIVNSLDTFLNVSISGNANTANSSLTSNNSTNFNGQNAAYYTNIVARLGYTPVNKAGDTVTGPIIFSNQVTLAETRTRISGVDANNNHLFRYGTNDTDVIFKYTRNGSNNYSFAFNGPITSSGATVWTSGNDGTGSGLDADLLDGSHATVFARLSGGTFTGAVTFNSVSQFSNTVNISNNLTVTGADIYTHRGNNTGVIYLGNTNTRYIYYDGTKYNMPGADLHVNGQLVWTQGNDGSSSGLHADLLDGQHGSYYQNANNINAGTLNAARLSGTYAISISGNANTTTQLATSRTISLTGDVTGSASFNGTSNAVLTTIVADNSHAHTIANITGLQSALNTKINIGDDIPWDTVTVRPSPRINLNISGDMTGNANTTLTELANGTININVSRNFSTGPGSGLNADLLDGQHGSYYATNSSLASYVLTSDYSNTDVLTKILNVDGTDSGLDADLLDGQHGSYYAANSSLSNYVLTSDYSNTDVLAKILNVDGTGSGLDADLLDGVHASQFVRTDVNNVRQGRFTFLDDGTESSLRLHGGTGDSNNRNPIIFCDMGTTARGYISPNNSLVINGDITAYSDERLKKDFESFDPFHILKSINGYKFTWNKPDYPHNNQKDYGVIAQEVEKIMPEIVEEQLDGYKTVSYDKLIPVLIEAIKKLKLEIDSLKTKN